jgi:hypothetical protein
MWNKPIALRRCHESLEQERIGNANEEVFWKFFVLGKKVGLHGDIGLASSSVGDRGQQVNQA